MKTLVVMLLVFCGYVVYSQTPSKLKSPIKICDATEGKKIPRSMNKKETRADSTISVKSFKRDGPTVELANDSIILAYPFLFESKVKNNLVPICATAILYDKDLFRVTSKRVQLNQFDTLVRLFFFFNDTMLAAATPIRSSDYKVELIIVNDGDTLAISRSQMPERFLK